jgi:hypothetical protein
MALLLVIVMHSCSSEAPDTTPPAQVTDLRVEAFTETTAVLIWTAPGDDGDRGQAAQYDLRVSTAPPPSDWLKATPVTADLPTPALPGEPDSAVVRGLPFGQVDAFALRTADASGNWSVFSSVVTIDASDPAPPARVTDLAIQDVAAHAVTLVFTAPGDDSLAGTAAAYDVRIATYWNEVTEATWASAKPLVVFGTPLAGGSTEHVRVTGLSPGWTTHLALRTRDNASRWSEISNVIVLTPTGDAVPPGTITDLEVVETGTRTATLRWTAPGNDGDEGRVDGYEVRYAASHIEDQEAWEAGRVVPVALTIREPGEVQTAVVSELPGSRTLWFAVRAKDRRYWGGVSNGASGFVQGAGRAWVIHEDGSGDAPTVQAGIDSAAVGDSVLVMPGRYYENLNFRGKDIVVLSAEGPEATIVDGSHKRGSVVVFRNGEGRAAVLQGFTITGGVGDLMDGATLDTIRHGGGILVLHSAPTIRGNLIKNNSVEEWGGGIMAADLGLGPDISGNIIRENWATFSGAGIALGGSGVIRGNVIEENVAFEGNGGGIWAGVSGYQIKVSILDNRILRNHAGFQGGGAHCTLGTPAGEMEIGGNFFLSNAAYGNGRAQLCGGGIWLYGGSYWVHHNTIVFNADYCVSDPPGGGGGIALLKAGPKVIENNIIAYSLRGGGIRCDGLSIPVIRNNLAWSNVGGEGYGSCADWTSTNGNLAVDPLFCDQPGGDYSLAASSPALTHPAGPLGAFPTAGCDAIAPQSATWGRISTLYQ